MGSSRKSTIQIPVEVRVVQKPRKRKNAELSSSIVYLAPEASALQEMSNGEFPDLPAEIDKQPVYYRWRDAAVCGNWKHPTKGFEVKITPERIDHWANQFNLMRQSGIDVPIVKDHKETADNTLGYVVAMKRDGDRLMQLHQYIGDDALAVATKNKLSIGIDMNYSDSSGTKYPDAIRHTAITPIPVIPGQKGFHAASRGPAEALIFLSRAAVGDDMKVTPEMLARVQTLCGGNVDEGNAFERLLSHAESLKDASTKVQQLSATVEDLKTKIPAPVNPDSLSDRLELSDARIDNAVLCGDIPKFVGDELKKRIRNADKPSVVMLSASDELGGERPIDVLLSMFRGKQLGLLARAGEKTGIQALSRNTPGDDEKKQPVNPYEQTIRHLTATK